MKKTHSMTMVCLPCHDDGIRREIRRAIAKPLRELHNQHVGDGELIGDCQTCAALRAIDAAIRAPRKARAK